VNAAAIDTRQFRSALGSFTTGVTIVTTRDGSGQDIGLTVNSFSSVSLEPPLVLWSLAKSAASHPAFLEAKYFAVHILAADQEQTSNRFSQRGADKFLGLQCERGHGGIPLLQGCAARFECASAFRHEGGDHEIFVGEVITFEHFNRPPLVFQGGKYALALKKAPRSDREARPRPESIDNFDPNALNVLLGMAYEQLKVNLQPELERHALREDEYWIVNIVGAEEGRTVAQLDALIAFTGKRVSPDSISALRERGFLDSRGSGSDAKISLTALGRRVLIELAAITRVIEEHAEGSLDYAEAQLLKQLLQRVIRSSFKNRHASLRRPH
jgi:3-hydroxy-9,10-secoandrosta-1,3,5(10)-triene-9,17-dione monooxygenase reductase component